MVYKKARKHFDKKIQRSKHDRARSRAKIEWEAEKEVGWARVYFNKYIKYKAENIGKISYYGHREDKRRYLKAVKGEIDKIAGDKKINTKEMQAFNKDLKTKSEVLKQRMVEQQRAYEEIKYREISKQASLDVRKADFAQAPIKLMIFSETLSKLNKTNLDTGTENAFNLDEQNLRLDLRIREKLVNIEESRIAYNEMLKTDHVIIGLEGPNLITDKDNKGNIELSSFSVDTHKGLKKGAKKKINWLDLYGEIQRNKLNIKKFKVVKNPETGKYETEHKDFSVDTPRDVLKERSEIGLVKILKKINEIYSLKGLENLPEDKKTLMQNALAENLNSMGLYFRKDGMKIVPTDRLLDADQITKKEVFERMLTGAHAIYRRLEAERNIETAEDPAMKVYYQAEAAMMSGLHMKAYAKYRTFLRLATGKKNPSIGGVSMPKKMASDMQVTALQVTADTYLKTKPGKAPLRIDAISNAVEQMKQASLSITDIAERYLNAAQQKATQEITKKELAPGYKIIKRVREMIQTGQANNLHDALVKLKKEGVFKQSFVHEKLGADGKWRKYRYKVEDFIPGLHILKTLGQITEIHNDKARFSLLYDEAQHTRKWGLTTQYFGAHAAYPFQKHTKLYSSATVLFKELMKEDLIKHRKGIQGRWDSHEYWDKVGAAKDKLERDPEYKKTALKLAIKTVGKEKFNKLSDNEKDLLITKFKKLIINQVLAAKEQKLLLDSYLKETKGEKNKAAKAYVGMENYFNDWKPWKWSDRAWDTVTKEAIINGLFLAVSGGAASVVRSGISYGGRRAITGGLGKLLGEKLGERIAGSLPVRLGIGLTAFGGEVVSFEASHRVLQTTRGAEGLFKWRGEHGFKEGLIHSFRLLGLMHLGGKVITPLIGKLTPYAGMSAEQLSRFQRFIQKAIPRTLSVAGFEAPMMTMLSMMYDNKEGKSALEIYATTIKDIAFIGLGRKMFNSATRQIFPRAMAKMEVRSKIMDLKGSRDSAKAAQGRFLESMLNKGNLPPEAIIQLANTKLDPTQILALSKFMKDPNNRDFLIYLKTFQKGKKMPKAIKEIHDEMIKKLKRYGLTKKQATKLIENASLEAMLRGENIMEDAYRKSFEQAMQQQLAEQAKTYLRENKTKIEGHLKDKKTKQAFVAFIKECNGDYSKFLAKYPKLKKYLPADLRKLSAIPATSIAEMLGISHSMALIVEGRSQLSREGKILYDHIQKGDLVHALEKGTLQKEIPELAKIFGEESYQHRTHQYEKVGDHTLAAIMNLRVSREYKRLVRQDPANKVILELATLFHDIAKKGGPKEGKRKVDTGHEYRSAEMAEKILKRMNLPKNIIDKVTTLIKYDSAVSAIALERMGKKGKNPMKHTTEIMADLIYDKNMLELVKALNYADIKSVNDRFKYEFLRKGLKKEIGKVYDEIGKLMDKNITQVRIMNFTEQNSSKIDHHLRKLQGKTYEEKQEYITKLYKTNKLEAASVAIKSLYQIESIHSGTKKQSLLKNIERYKKKEKLLEKTTETIDKIRKVKDKDLQYALMQMLYFDNPALYVAAMEKLSFGISAETSRSNRVEKVKKLLREFTTKEDRDAVRMLAIRLQREVLPNLLDTHTTSSDGLPGIIANGGLESAMARRAKGGALKDTKGEDLKLGGSLATFSYHGTYFEQAGDVYMTIRREFIKSQNPKDHVYVSEDYVLKHPRQMDKLDARQRVSFDQKIRDVMKRADMQKYLAYKMAAEIVRREKRNGVKAKDIPYTDLTLGLVDYFRTQMNALKLPKSGLGGRPEGRMKFKIPIEALKIKVRNVTIKEKLKRLKKDLDKLKKTRKEGDELEAQGKKAEAADKYYRSNPEKIKALEEAIKSYEHAIATKPDMTLKDYIIFKVKSEITSYERILRENPNDTKAKEVLSRLKKFKPEQITEFEKGKLKGNKEYLAREYLESALGIEMPITTKFERYSKTSIINKAKTIEIYDSSGYLSLLKTYLVDNVKIPKDALTMKNNRIVIDKTKVNMKQIDIKSRVIEFLNNYEKIKREAAQKARETKKSREGLPKDKIPQLEQILKKYQTSHDLPNAAYNAVKGLIIKTGASGLPTLKKGIKTKFKLPDKMIEDIEILLK